MERGEAPPNAAPLILQGKELLRAGDVHGAARSFHAAVASDPRDSHAHYCLAVVLERLARADEALAHYDRALAIDPRLVGAFVNSGNLLRARGDLDGARDRYRRALDVDPGDAHALNNLAGLAFESRDLPEARRLYERAVESGSPEASLGLAKVHALVGAELLRSARYEEAERQYREALELQPSLAMAHSGLASALAEQDQHESAIALYREALRLDPGDYEAINNLACLALDAGEVEEAKLLFGRAAGAQPEARYNLSLIALREHDFESGWDAYDLRSEVDPATIGLTRSDLPLLDAGNLSTARRVAVRKEQGLGEQILFLTLLTELTDLGLEAVVESDARLLAAYRRSLPEVTFVAPADANDAFRSCDHQIPVASLGSLFRRTRESFSGQPKSLLVADPARVRRVEEVIPAGRRIGISWRSFQKGRHRRNCERKSAEIESLAPLERSGARLLDLQYGDAAHERTAFDARHPGLRVEVPGLDRFNDLEGVLAAIETCERVVTTSNVTAHFAGALGKPTWLVYLAAQPPFHYWAPGPDGRSLWYPSVEIMTDASWTTWETAFEAVARRLGGAGN